MMDGWEKASIDLSSRKADAESKTVRGVVESLDHGTYTFENNVHDRLCTHGQQWTLDFRDAQYAALLCITDFQNSLKEK